MVFTASTFLQVILMQRLLDYTPSQAALVLLPGSLVLSLSFPLAGPHGRPLRSSLHDARRPQRAHRGVVSLYVPPPRLAAALDGLAGRAALRLWQLRLHAPARVALSHLPPEKVRMGSGLLNLMQNGLGNTLGLALVTTVLARRLTSHHSTLDQHQAVSALSWGEVLAPVHLLVQQAGTPGQPEDPAGLALVSRHLEQQAAVAAYQRLLHAGDAAESAQVCRWCYSCADQRHERAGTSLTASAPPRALVSYGPDSPGF